MLAATGGVCDAEDKVALNLSIFVLTKTDMTSLIITPKNDSELKLLKKLLKGLGIANHALTAEEKEDFGLAILMKEADRSKKVSRETIMKKLK
jgi:hypothetical protein